VADPAAAPPAAPNPGEVYEREMVPGLFGPWAADLVERAAPAAGARALDVACGTGVVTRLLPPRVGPAGRVVGLDLNPGMLAAARAATAGAPIEWLEGSAQAMPLPDGAFDLVLCQQGLQFFPDKPAALREMHRVLAPGGRLFLAVWKSSVHCPGFAALERGLAKYVGAEAAKLPPFSFGDRAALRRVIAGAGFRELTIRAEVKMTRFPSPEAFFKSITAGAPAMLGLLAQLTEPQRRELIRELNETLAPHLDDTGLAFPQPAHLASARK
jgi:ubiquinone/menaquinone biosynthesis C-methylase UbiE